MPIISNFLKIRHKHSLRGGLRLFIDFLSFIVQHVLYYFSLHLAQSSFPRPLSSKDEKSCFEAMAAGDKPSRDKLINHNLRLVAHIIKKYYTNANDQDDLISIGTIGLIKAVDTFSYSKGVRFATYASRCIENEVLMQFRAARKTQNTMYINDPLDTDSEGNSLTILDVISDDTDISDAYEHSYNLTQVREAVENSLYDREKQVIYMRFGLDTEQPMTQQQVAIKLGISRSYVSRIEKKAIEILKKKFFE